ncbi:MAG: N-6 DNA methylase, partial [Alphaproteobacteria bacterium]
MKKQTKLSEKPTRIPDTRESHWLEAIPAYLRDVQAQRSESARSHRFAMLLQELFGVEPGFVEAYTTGIEKYLKVKGKDRILKGEADNLFGNIVIEFEASLAKNRYEAEEQLRRYVAILWSHEPADVRTPYLCLAADGVRFIAYSPALAAKTMYEISPDEIRLEVIEDADWTKLQPQEIYFWLDRYFLRKEILHPTSETIVFDFGIKSHAFQITTRALFTLWKEIKSQGAFAVMFDSWDKYLHIVYGMQVAGDELFIRHTYLATLAKLMAWKRITESATLPNDAQIIELLEGRLFKAQGIENFIEEDFFSWLAREGAIKVGIYTVRWLFSLLQNYNLRELSEDVLKSLYQELVDPETRHDLGEFYTPDWLAHRVVRKLLDENPNGAVLDPTCGSGTFIYLTIREKRERLHDSAQTLQHILDSVYGADIHPLAVIIAKTNYILALGDLLRKRKGAITIPIYLTDTIKLPTYERETKMVEINGAFVQQLSGYLVELEGNEIRLPEPLLDDLALYDQAIELAKEYARQNKGKYIALEPFRNFLAAQRFPNTDNAALVQSLFVIVETLKHFIDADRDSIWAFVLKNIYKPLFFKRNFDFIVGNPPWIAY